ncbi:hypothetical protein D3C87_1219310 [compost metagenome]
MNQNFSYTQQQFQDLSATETKILLWILNNCVDQAPEPFKIANMAVAKGCSFSLPTVAKGIQNLLKQGFLILHDRPYKTSPAMYRLATQQDSALIASNKVSELQNEQMPPIAKDTSPAPRELLISQIIHDNALQLIQPEHITAAKQVYGICLNQNDLKAFYVSNVWKRRDQFFNDDQTATFLSDLLLDVPLKKIVHRYLTQELQQPSLQSHPEHSCVDPNNEPSQINLNGD